MMRIALLGLLSLLPLCSAWESLGNYAPYPDNAADLVKATTEELASVAPQVEVLLTIPGKDWFIHMQQVAVRNADLFNFEVNYVMQDGLDIGCRATNGKQANNNSTGRITDHHPVGKHGNGNEMCNSHCTHKGRYCPSFTKEELATRTEHKGADLVLEVLRRLCLGNTLDQKFNDRLWYEYMAQFKDKDCLKKGNDLNQCSKHILDLLPDFPTDDGSAFATCVKEVDADTDTTNAILEESLERTYGIPYDIEDLPILEIDGMVNNQAGSRADHLEEAWCAKFPGPTKPLTCDFCAACKNAKNCLWKLQCDGHHFDIETYKDPKHPHAGQSDLQIVGEEAQEVVRGTAEILGFGIAIGVVGAALLWGLVEMKRKRAVAEVAKELPADGFRDGDDVELPEVS